MTVMPQSRPLLERSRAIPYAFQHASAEFRHRMLFYKLTEVLEHHIYRTVEGVTSIPLLMCNICCMRAKHLVGALLLL